MIGNKSLNGGKFIIALMCFEIIIKAVRGIMGVIGSVIDAYNIQR